MNTIHRTALLRIYEKAAQQMYYRSTQNIKVSPYQTRSQRSTSYKQYRRHEQKGHVEHQEDRIILFLSPTCQLQETVKALLVLDGTSSLKMGCNILLEFSTMARHLQRYVCVPDDLRTGTSSLRKCNGEGIPHAEDDIVGRSAGYDEGDPVVLDSCWRNCLGF